MTDSTNVSILKRTEKMVSYVKAVSGYCNTYYNAEDAYTPHGECPFWNGVDCVIQEVHPSLWKNFEIQLDNTIEEG